ncbi:MAG TPA: hypothetical protein PKL69_01150 [Agitococcus sp.]|nr:hypothetical protein [Agitococcus sp.]HND37308.1 hypothetical protein [Nitrosomonas sp.]HNG37293.1 hypothetical protein [Nitrosomonas sp.]HNH52666.1 hypothetical protein [Nitrosomonas sp.]HNI62386.1 hypothetical protein [Agitococcus sp.]
MGISKSFKAASTVFPAGNDHYHLACACQEFGHQVVRTAIATDLVVTHGLSILDASHVAGCSLDIMLAMQRGEAPMKQMREKLVAEQATKASKDDCFDIICVS